MYTIKHGLTIYCVNFCRTRYLYNFEWFTGKAEAHGAGQPTDMTPLDEDDDESYGYILQLLLDEQHGLITPDFDDTGCCWYLDKAFTSFRLARALAKRRNAIVGMLRTAGRPKSRPRGTTEYWPFRGMSKAELDEYVRGFRREAYTKACNSALATGDVEWIRAELWRDSKWVTLLATTYHSASDAEVDRWTKAAGRRLPVPCSIALRKYNKNMGAVDGFNRELAATHMQLGRCKQRWQRSCFLGWLLPAVGRVNVRTAFCEIMKLVWGKGALDTLKRARGVATTGFNKWFQSRLGEAVLREGVKAVTCENEGHDPYFMPMKREEGYWVRPPLVLPTPPGAQEEAHSKYRVNFTEKPKAILTMRDANGKPCR